MYETGMECYFSWLHFLPGAPCSRVLGCSLVLPVLMGGGQGGINVKICVQIYVVLWYRYCAHPSMFFPQTGLMPRSASSLTAWDAEVPTDSARSRLRT